MTLDLDGRVAVVTGAGRGVGRSIAEALAGAGATVVLAARSKDQLDEAASAIASAGGGKAVTVPGDVTSPSFVDQLVLTAHEQAGPVTVLVNSAGIIGPIATLADTDRDAWLDTLLVNTYGAYLTCRAFLPDMIADGWGRIVNVTSAASVHPPTPMISAYGSSKVALNQLTRHLAAEIAGSGVTANVLHPGDVKTEMWAEIRDQAEALGADGEVWRNWVRWVDETGGDPPEKAGAAVLRIVGDASVNGTFQWIDGGLQDPVPSWDEPGDERPWTS